MRVSRRISGRTVGAAILTFFTVSCGGEGPGIEDSSSIAAIMATPEFKEACAQRPTCAEPRFLSSGPTETIWRVQVVREASGEIRFGQIDSIEVTEGRGVPLGRRSGDFLLVGLDEAGEPVDGQLISFPGVARLEFQDRQTPPELVDLGESEVSVTGYVRAVPSIESLVVRDASGKAVATAAAQATQAMAAPAPQAPFHLGFAAPAMAQWGGIENTSSCSHVRVLTEAEGLLPGGAPEGLVTVQTPGENQLLTIMEALGRMTPLLCQSVSRIAVGKFPQGADPQFVTVGVVRSVLWGDVVNINGDFYSEAALTGSSASTRQLEMQQTILHEAAHSADNLLNVEGDLTLTGLESGGWSPEARQVAEETLDRVRLGTGFSDEWDRVHESFVEVDWAGDYIEHAAALTLSPAGIAGKGFMSPYGATSAPDDIAEIIAWIYMGPVDPSSSDFACQQMQAHSANDLPSRLAAVYTKVHFVGDLGLVTPADVTACTGGNIGLPITTPGFEIWQAGTKMRDFHQDPEAGMSLVLNRFEMTAGGQMSFGGQQYPATMTLRLGLTPITLPGVDTPWPRGVYEFGLVDPDTLEMRLDGKSDGDFNSYAGFVIVAEASNERIVGSIVLQRSWRWKWSVPQTFEPPWMIRFLMEK